MPEHRELPLFRFGEELRRHRRARRSFQLRAAAIAGTTLIASATLATLMWPPRPVLLWNATASSPVGLYRVESLEDVAPGEMVIAWPPDEARRLGAERRYLPSNVPLVKRVAASDGDRVCAVGEAVFVNGAVVASRQANDPSGRPMPWWTGCEVLGEGDFFLLTSGASLAFDGRYFGFTARQQIVGRARLLWAAR